MENEQSNLLPEVVELPDSWWYRVYIGVMVTNVLVILALEAFTLYFSG